MLSTANHSTFCIFEGGALSKQDIDGAFKRGDVIMKNNAFYEKIKLENIF